MESEADESSLVDNHPDGSTVRLLGPDSRVIIRHRGTRGSSGGASTHSLNEADLQVRIARSIYYYYYLFILPFRMILQKLKRKGRQTSYVYYPKDYPYKNPSQHPQSLLLFRNQLWSAPKQHFQCTYEYKHIYIKI